MGRFSRFAAFLCLRDSFINGAHKEERALRQVVMLAFNDFAEASEGLAQRDIHAGQAGKLLTDEEGLGQEPLNLTGNKSEGSHKRSSRLPERKPQIKSLFGRVSSI